MKTIHEEDSPTDVFKKEFRNMLDLRDHGIKCNVCKKKLIEEINIESHLKLWDYLKFVNFIAKTFKTCELHAQCDLFIVLNLPHPWSKCHIKHFLGQNVLSPSFFSNPPPCNFFFK